MNFLSKEAFASSLFNDLKGGKNSYMRINRLESSNFDMTWIKEIEDCILDLGDIVANPREVTKTVSNIVPVELAKKTTAESVIHLASHTQYVKEVTKEGNVVPNKILTMSSEEDIHTYENRFIATLIRRLLLFVEKRYEFVKKFAPLHDEEILYFKTEAIVDGAQVEIETKIKVRSESDTEIANMSNKYIDRILKIREYVVYFYGSKFMKEMKTERDVRNPIIMTNILRKNPKYHKCYELFRFIEKYDRLGVSYKIDEDVAIFTEQELNEINYVMLANYLAVKAKDKTTVMKGKSHVYKPKILSSIDDEPFIYGDILSGPIEFVRVDQAYQDYLDSLVSQELPQYMTKVEKEYYKKEITAKTARKTEKSELEKLSRRKKKEQLEHEKRVKNIIAQREKEERDRIAREEQLAREEEERKIEAARQALVEEAVKGKEEIPEELKAQEEQELLGEEVVEEVQPEEEIDTPEVVEEIPEEEPVIESDEEDKKE